MGHQLKGQPRNAVTALPRLPPKGGPPAQDVSYGTKTAEIADERSENMTIVKVRKPALWDSSATREGQGGQASMFATARLAAIHSSKFGLSLAPFRASLKHDMFWTQQMKHVLLASTFLLLSAFAAGAAGNCLTDTTQANFQAGVANSVDLTSSPGDVLLTSTAGSPAVDAQNTSFTTLGEVFSNTQWNAQTFTAGKSGSLSRADVNLFCYFCGSTPPSITVSIRATSGGVPTGGDLATASTAITNWSVGSQVWFTANFAAPATVSAGTQYALVVRASAAYVAGTLAFSDSATNGGAAANDVYGGGKLFYSTNSGSAWTVQMYGATNTSDAAFKTYIGTGTSGYNSAGDLISSVKDGGTSPTWSTVSWNGSTPTGTALKFQAAASSSPTGTFTFVGPDGTSGSYYTNGASLDRFTGSRYLKYRAFLTGNSSSTPTLSDATVCYTAPASADLSITNTDGAATAVPGGTVTYAIHAANAGPNAVTNATVTDAFPAALSSCRWTCSGAASGTCAASGAGNISDSTVNLPVGASVNYSATCSVAASASGTLTNTASISSSTSDPATGNNSASDSDTLTPQADLSISNNDGAASVSAGGSTTYTLVAGNNGPSNVTGAVVTDTFPSSLTCTWTCSASAGSTCPASGSGNISSSVNLLDGGSATFSASCAVSAAATGTITNTASISAPNGVTDPATANNTATDTDSVGVAASPPSLSLTDNLDFVRVGDVVSYVIHVSNPGSTITPTITDTLPVQNLDGVSWNCSAGGGATCGSANGTGNTLSDSPTLPAGGVVDYTYTATVLAANSNGEVSNTASMKITGHASNMSASDADTVVVFISGFESNSAPLAISPTGSSATGAVTAQLGVDGGLLAKLGPAPVTVASAQSPSGQTLFSLQLMRSGNDVLLRSLTTIDGGPFSDVSPWQVVDLRALRLGFEWQSATTRGDDGYLRSGSAAQQALIAANNSHEVPTQLRVADVNGIPWLALVGP